MQNASAMQVDLKLSCPGDVMRSSPDRGVGVVVSRVVGGPWCHFFPPLGRLSPSVLDPRYALGPRPPRGVSSLLECRRALGPTVSEARGWRPRRRSRGVRGVGLEPAPVPRALIDEPWVGPSALVLNPCRRPRPTSTSTAAGRRSPELLHIAGAKCSCNATAFCTV